MTFPDGREVCTKTRLGKLEYDARRVAMWIRQGGKDAITGEWVDVSVAQFDHEAGRGANGGHRDDRILNEDGSWKNAVLSPAGNTLKGSKRYHWENGKYVPNPSRVLAKEVA